MLIASPIIKLQDSMKISEHFSKTKFFYIYDTKTKKGEVIQNKFVTLERGGGKAVAAWLLEMGVKLLIATEIGKGARIVLKGNADIMEATQPTIEENIKSYLAGELVLLRQK